MCGTICSRGTAWYQWLYGTMVPQVPRDVLFSSYRGRVLLAIGAAWYHRLYGTTICSRGAAWYQRLYSTTVPQVPHNVLLSSYRGRILLAIGAAWYHRLYDTTVPREFTCYLFYLRKAISKAILCFFFFLL